MHDGRIEHMFGAQDACGKGVVVIAGKYGHRPVSDYGAVVVLIIDKMYRGSAALGVRGNHSPVRTCPIHAVATKLREWCRVHVHHPAVKVPRDTRGNELEVTGECNDV